MNLKQYYLGCLSHASYLITDEKTHSAVVVDPQRDVEQYIADAAAVCCEVKYVFLTHFHADFLAGHIELRDKCGAKIYLGQRAEPEFEATKVKDGDRIEFGDVRLEILETPGHTPEGISILVYDLAKNADKPLAVLTGDTLFIGDVGRPDLLASIGVTADELSEMLYDSLTNKLVKLPDETLVYPAHGAGSMCGKNLSKETVSTIGEQKKFNYALQPMSREDFKRIVTAEQPEAPSYFVHDAILNRQERPNLDDTLSESLNALSLEEVLRLKNQGAQLLDVREAIDFEGAHLAGAINVGIQGKYATWCGTVLDHKHPIVVIAEARQEQEAVMRLGRIGFDNVAGYLRDGMDALRDRPDLVRKIERITAVALSEQLTTTAAPTVVDVRSEKEWAAGHVADSLNIPLNHLRDRVKEIAKDRAVVVHCEGGYRSAIAASVLAQAGRLDVLDMVGGFKAWAASKLPVQMEATTGAAVQRDAITAKGRFMAILTLLFGALVGFSLGLTGGGGAIFAVPLLVYGLGVPAREAVGVSLLTVGATSLVGFVQRARSRMVEFPTGLLFAVAGMIGAPVGAMLADRIPEAVLLGLFALLMLVIAMRMWLKASDSSAHLPIIMADNAGPTCRRDPEGKLRLTSQCAMLLAVIGLGAGVLSGLFGVGGGFIIVPALVMFSGMGMQRAIGTSLLVITLISASGTASHLLAGKDLTLSTAGLFTVGSVAGLFAGSGLAQRLAGPTLQRVFAAAIFVVALFVMVRTLWQ